MKNVGTVEVLTERGVRAFPHEEETVLVPSVSRVRMATAAALAACTLTGNVLEADAAGAVGDIDTTVTPAVGDLILVKNQVAGLQNGVYEFLSVGGNTEKWKLRRAVGWDVSARVKAGRIVAVSEGTANGNSAFLLTTNDPIVLNTTELVFGSALAAAPGAASITNAMLAPNAVDGTRLADDAVDSEHITAGAIDTEHLANAQVTAAKLATDNAASVEVDHEDTSPVTLLAAAAGVTRLVRVTAVCTETLGGTTPASMAVGTAGTPELVLSAAALAPSSGGGDSGDVTEGVAVLPAATALICTVTDGVDGTPAGKITFFVSATPMPTP